MLQNYLKVAVRNLLKGRLYSIINIVGLSVGTAVCILMMLFATDEWSFDTFHTKADRIHRLWVKEHYKGEVFFNTTTPVILGTELKDNFPEIKQVTRLLTEQSLVKKGNFIEPEALTFVDPSFFKVFDFQLLKGKTDQIFANLHQIVITEEMGEKYFGDPSPMGQTLSMQIDSAWTAFVVAGIIEKAPANSSIQYDFLLPFENTEVFISEDGAKCWTCVFGETYALLDEESTFLEMEAKIAPFIDSKVADGYQSGEYLVGFQPLTDIHLNNDYPMGIAPVSDGRYPYILSGIALLILLLACINFTTLAVGRSVTRAKEVGVRKVTGATRWQLMMQFWSEAILMAGIAVAIGVLLAELAIPTFNSLADKELAFQFSLTNGLFLLGLIAVVGLSSGIYPALVVSGFAPIQAIHGLISKIGSDKHVLLRGLIGFQFVLSIALISSTLIMTQQMDFLQNKNLGFDQEATLILPYEVSGQRLSEMWQNADRIAEQLRTELSGSQGIEDITISSHTFGAPGWLTLGYTEADSDRFRRFVAQQTDYNYLDLMGIKVKEGRNFSKDIRTDNRGAIVNTAMVQEYGWDNPIGQTLPEPFQDYQIIGTTDDFHFASLHTTVTPLVMVTDLIPMFRLAPDRNWTDSPIPKLAFKLNTSNLPATLTSIRQHWKEAAPQLAFNYTFLDDNIDAQYRSEIRLSHIVSLATMLAIFIACLGLFGIATLTIAQRTKEIGVRKVLGASTADIVLMLNQRMTWMVFIATLIAVPLAWYVMTTWLDDFAYRIDLSPLIFIFGGVAALGIAWLSVSYQSIRAALGNPIKALRTE